MRKGWIIALAIFLLIIGVALGISVYNKNKTDNTNIVDNKKLAEENEINNVVPTAVVEEKVSPNAKVIQKQYFTGCNHLLKETKDIPENLVNKNKEEVEKYYKDWNVDSFSKNEIIIYKEESGFCNQHYLIKEHNGVLGVYTIDGNGKITLKEDTEIQTMYLPEADLEKVKQGIEAVGNMELNSALEDFE